MSYKGFFPGMICLGKQYAEHELFEEIDILPCEAGLNQGKLDYFSDGATIKLFSGLVRDLRTMTRRKDY